MISFFECWVSAATALFAQALAGEPQLVESLPKPLEGGSFGFAATISGDHEGRFAVVLESSILDAPLMGEGMAQKAAWGELLREIAESAVGDLLARGGLKCKIESFEEIEAESKVSSAFLVKGADRSWTVLVRDSVRPAVARPAVPDASAVPEAPPPPLQSRLAPESAPPVLSAGLELLLDVELEATLRFGCRELPLGDILDLGPGDVVQLDRHVTDPVDLIVGDKIVARGDVVLVNGNFGLRVTEVAAPRKRLESIRCLF